MRSNPSYLLKSFILYCPAQDSSEFLENLGDITLNIQSSFYYVSMENVKQLSLKLLSAAAGQGGRTG